MTVVEELEKAWNDSSKESGFHDPEAMTIFRAEKARDAFYQLFFKKTGMHDSLVRGLFQDWCKLPVEEAVELKRKYNTSNGFCAYLASYIEKRVAAAGSSTAYTYGDEGGDYSDEVH